MLFDIHLLLNPKRKEKKGLIFQGPSFKLSVPGYAPLEAFLVAFQTMARMLHAPLGKKYFSFSFLFFFSGFLLVLVLRTVVWYSCRNFVP